MNKDYTHICIILDRTGSMQSIRNDTIGGFNTFLHEQQALPGNTTLTLVQFDSQDPYEVIHRFQAIEAVPDLTTDTFVPRASTPLLDAMGRGINDLANSLDALKKKSRPSRVVMVIVTDGQENASREFTRPKIQKMIKRMQKKRDWQFVFLSADMDAITDVLDYGFRGSSVMGYDKTSAGTDKAWKSLRLRLRDYHTGVSEDLAFLEEDRKLQDIEKQRRDTRVIDPASQRKPDGDNS